MQRHALPIALLAFLLVSGQFTTAPDGSPECVHSMGFNPVAKYGRTATGDFDGNGMQDILCERDQLLEIVGAPGLYGWWADGFGSCNDLATIPATTPGECDEVIVVGIHGAKIMTEFGNPHPDTGFSDPVIKNEGSNLWIGARLVATGEVAGESRARVVGVMGDGVTLRTLRDVGSGYNDYDVILTESFEGDVEEILIVDFEGDDLPEITLMTATAIHIYDLNGLHRVSFPLAEDWSYDTIVSGRQSAGATDEWIVSIVRSPFDKQYVVPITVNAVLPPVYIAGDPDVVTVSTGDCNQDGSSDLLLVMKSRREHWLLDNMNGADGPPLFAMGAQGKTVLAFAGGGDGPATKAVAGLADIDGDGDLDTLFPVQGNSELLTRWNQTIKEDEFKPMVVPTEPGFDASYTTATPAIEHDPAVGDPDQLQLTVYVTEPEDLNHPHEPTHLEIVVFEKPNTGATTRPRSVRRKTVPWNDEPMFVDMEFPEPWLLNLGGPNSVVQFENIYFWHERLLVLDEHGRLVHAFPAQVYGAETSVFHFNQQHLEDYALAGTEPIGITHTATGDQVGDVIPLPCLPTPTPGTPVN